MRNARNLRRLMVIASSAAALGALAPAAGASHTGKEHVSLGPTGGNGASEAFMNATSANGSRVYFDTDEQLVAADTDASFDLYERQGGTTTLLSTGPAGGNGAFDVFFAAASADGTRAFFETDEQLVAADTDSAFDVYERSGGTTTLISTGSAGGNGPHDVTFHEISQDGSRVFFETDEQLASTDTDAEPDLYVRSGGTTTQISLGPAGGNGPTFVPSWGGVSDDGAHAYFETRESLVAADTDGSFDVYDRSGSTTTLVSTGPAGGNGNFDAVYRDSAADGSHVFFTTSEALVSSDTDAHSDVYARSGTTTTHISIGPSGGNGAIPAVFEAASTDGSRVHFSTGESLTASDTDSRKDVYRRSGSTTEHVSAGPAGGNGPFSATFVAASADGTRTYLETEEALVAGDIDTGCTTSIGNEGPQCRDVYEHAGGTATLVSVGPAGGNGSFDAGFAAVSLDGARIFFDTREKLVSSDTDSSPDLYERFSGTTTHISIGPAGGNGAFSAFMFDTWLSNDGTRAYFDTREKLLSSDTDGSVDIYGASLSTYPRPLSASKARTSLVPAFAACTAPNRTHGPPLAAPSCSPPAGTSSQATTSGTAFVGSVVYGVQAGSPGPPEDSDVRIRSALADVRCVASGSSCGSANGAGTADYNGELRVAVEIQITDRWNGTAPGGGSDPATVQAVTLERSFPCSGTASTATGSDCNLTTTANAFLPGLVRDGQRANWELGQVRVYDGGADGDADTPAGDTLFAVQGVFIP